MSTSQRTFNLKKLPLFLHIIVNWGSFKGEGTQISCVKPNLTPHSKKEFSRHLQILV